MLQKIFALLVLIFFAELIVLIEIGKVIGTLNTISLIVISVFFGIIAIRLEGGRVWKQAQKEFRQSQLPADKLLDGLLILGGGILLIIPGVLTDIVGILLIISYTRVLFRKIVKNQFTKHQRRNTSRTKVEVIQIDELK